MVLQTAIEGLNTTIGKAIGRIENAITMSDQAQKASLALGMSLEGANKTLDGSIKGLRGSFGTRLQAGLAALNAGFQGNIESVGKLINQQQLTGGNFRKTAAGLAKLETTMGLTRGQTSDLAEAMLETSQTFGVSTDKLVASLDALSESMPILTEAGLAGVPGAVAAMAGRVGPQMEQELKRVMGFLFDPSMETQGKLAALGLGNLRERMSAGQNPLDAFLDAIPQASNVIGQLGGDLSQFYAGFSVPLKMFGPVAKDFIALQKAMSARNMVEVRNQAEFFEQISVLKSEILAPLDRLFSDKLFPKVLQFVDLLGRVAKPIIEDIEKGLTEFFEDPGVKFKTFIGFLDETALNFTKVINGLITGVNFMTEAMITFVGQLNQMNVSIAGKEFGISMETEEMRAIKKQIQEAENKLFSMSDQDAETGLPTFNGGLGIRIQQMKIAELQKEYDNFFTDFAKNAKIGHIEERTSRFSKAVAEREAEMSKRTAENTAAIAEHTDPDKLKDKIPFMLDASITSLSDALLAISRRAVEEPDPNQEAMIMALGSIDDNTANMGGLGFTGRGR